MVILGKGVLKVCSKFTGEHLRRNAVSVKLQSNLIEITLRLGCSPINLLHIFRTPFLKNTSVRLLLMIKTAHLENIISTSAIKTLKKSMQLVIDYIQS